MECISKTLKGSRCKKSVVKGTDKCKIHSKTKSSSKQKLKKFVNKKDIRPSKKVMSNPTKLFYIIFAASRNSIDPIFIKAASHEEVITLWLSQKDSTKVLLEIFVTCSRSLKYQNKNLYKEIEKWNDIEVVGEEEKRKKMERLVSRKAKKIIDENREDLSEAIRLCEYVYVGKVKESL